MEYKVRYLIGYPDWDKPKNVILVIDNGSMRIAEPYTKKDIVIDCANILDISFEAMKKRSGSSAATGALVGGVLTGGIGLLAGAAIGARAKDKSELTILFEENGRERIVTLQTKDKTNAIFNAIQDAIEYAKANPEASSNLKTEIEKLNEQPMTTGAKIFAAVIVVAIIFLVVWFFKGCADAWNSVAV